MVAAKQIFLGESLSAKSYVQDGLVAMWDGIENAGWGTHDESATTWKDLVGNDDLSVDLTIGGWGDAYFSANSGTNCIGTKSYTPLHGEFVCREQSHGRYDITINYVSAGNGSYGFSRFWFEHLCPGKRGLQSSPSITSSLTAFELISFNYKEGEVFLGNSGPFVCNYTYPNGPTSLTNYVCVSIGNSVSMDVAAIRLYSKQLSLGQVAANYAVDKVRFGLT